MKPVRRRRRLEPRSRWGQRANPRVKPYEPNRHLVVDADRPPRPSDAVPAGPERAALTCQAKQPYLSELLARNAATLIVLAGGSPQRPYRCGFCPDWHLTSSVR